MKPPRKHIITGTCRTCGRVPGTVSRPLTHLERLGMLDAGFKLDKNVHGDDIASDPHPKGGWNDALHVFCRAGHPKTIRSTWHEKVMTDAAQDPFG